MGGDAIQFFVSALDLGCANPLLEKIHNKKKRMPAIIPKDNRKRWLEDIGPDETMELLEPIDDSLLEAHPVSRLVSFKNMNRNVPEAIVPAEYDALKYSQRTLFE